MSDPSENFFDMSIASNIVRKIVPLSLRRKLWTIRNIPKGYADQWKSRRLAKKKLPKLHKLAKRKKSSFIGRSIAIVGAFSAPRTGMGRGAELLARCLEAKSIKVTRVNVPTNLASVETTAITIQQCNSVDDISDVIFVINPPLLTTVIETFDTDWLLKRRVIAHWVWELNRLGPDWTKPASYCDEIWAASEFVADAIRSSLPPSFPKPKVVPYPVDIDPFPHPNPTERAAVRLRLGITAEMFVIGYSFTVSSNLPRKNPAGALKAFQLAFGDSKNLRLIIRALDISENEIGWSDFRVAVGGDPRVILIENSNDLSINDFYGAIDLYVSPSRSEGYGLNLVEAIQSGVPVLAIGWSLSSDITRRKNVTPVGFHLVPVQDPQGNYTDIVGASWAEPDIVDFAEKMKIYKSRFDANSGSHRNATGAKS